MKEKEKEKDVALPSGMVRSADDWKINYLLVRDGPLYERWARHLTHAVKSKGKRNWMRAHTEEDLERFLESAARHFEQWLTHMRGRPDPEDHAAALAFNINGAEYVYWQLAKDPSFRYGARE